MVESGVGSLLTAEQRGVKVEVLLKIRLIGVCRNQRQTKENNQSDGSDKIERHPSSASGSRLAEAANLLYKQCGKGEKKK